jgi:hypothetical protein
MSEMIEQVAMALRQVDIAAGAHLPMGEMYRTAARAAIKAMREPTPAMHDAIVDCFSATEAWQAMIDAALASPNGVGK